MSHLIALLRGVNMGKYNKIPMKTLVSVLSDAGFRDVRYYIQSGNLVFPRRNMDAPTAAARIESVIRDAFGFDIPTLVRSPEYVHTVINENPFLQQGTEAENKLYFVFMQSEASRERIDKLAETDFAPEAYVIKGDVIYLLCPGGYGNAKLNNNFFESKLKVTATTRNLNTVRELIRMTQAP